MSYICDCCGRECEELVTRYDDREFWGYRVTEAIWCCPYCGGSVTEIETKDEDN